MTKSIQSNNGELVKLQIWDTAGQDKFRCITRNYFRGSNGIMLIYDITNPTSFKNIKNWVNQIREVLHDEVCITLIGNKCDLEEKRKIKSEEAMEIARIFNMDYFETSAKVNFGIKESFVNLSEKMILKYNEKLLKEKEDEEFKRRNVSVRISKNSKSSGKGKKTGIFSFC